MNSQKDFVENVCDLGNSFGTPDTPLPGLLALRVGDLFVRNPRGVPACLYKSSTPTYMSSIPLFSDLLWFFEEHVL